MSRSKSPVINIFLLLLLLLFDSADSDGWPSSGPLHDADRTDVDSENSADSDTNSDADSDSDDGVVVASFGRNAHVAAWERRNGQMVVVVAGTSARGRSLSNSDLLHPSTAVELAVAEASSPSDSLLLLLDDVDSDSDGDSSV